MQNSVLLGLGKRMIPIPGFVWTKLIAQNAQKAAANLDFMTEDHHRVRDYVVSQMPDSQGPITPEVIATQLNMPVNRVIQLLDQMEKRLTFLYRGCGTAVSWAYPMTVDKTPHRIEFDSGEHVHAA